MCTYDNTCTCMYNVLGNHQSNHISGNHYLPIVFGYQVYMYCNTGRKGNPKSTNYWYGNLCMKYIHKYINKNIKSFILVKLIYSSDIHKYYIKMYAG